MLFFDDGPFLDAARTAAKGVRNARRNVNDKRWFTWRGIWRLNCLNTVDIVFSHSFNDRFAMVRAEKYSVEGFFALGALYKCTAR